MTQLSLFSPASDYHPLPGAWDEMWDDETGVRPHWTHRVDGVAGLGAAEWAARGQRIGRLLRENGVTYHVYSDPRGFSRTWELDPIPLVLDGNEWLSIAAGLEQRARLLDRVEYDWVKRPSSQDQEDERADLWLGRLIDTLAGFAGLAAETLAHADAFRFFDLGRRIERGLTAGTVLSSILDSRLSNEVERESLSLVLQTADSLITFRRRYRCEPFLGGVLELLLWDTGNPRALIYQLRTARLHLAAIAPPEQTCQGEHHLRLALERLDADKASLASPTLEVGERARLTFMLGEVSGHLYRASDAITQTWFTHARALHALSAETQSFSENQWARA